MSERNSLALILISAFLGYRLPQDIGSNGLMTLLGIGWIVYFILAFLAYRRGETVFAWQKR